MHIKESTITLASQHRLDSTDRRQILQRGDLDDEQFPAAFRQMLERLRPEEPIKTAILTVAEAKPAEAEPKEKALTHLLRLLLGLQDEPEKPITPNIADTTETAPAQRLRALPRLELVQTRETESCSFSASGKVCLADGSTREFDVDYAMERSEENTRLSLGGGIDPLVLDFGAPSSRLSEQETSFDLDADGKTEMMHLPEAGSAILFHDLNGNGKADDGRELFGPQSGNGFKELAALDSDGNQWIDEGDAAYDELMLWRTEADGTQAFVSLAEAGIGALSTRHTETLFTIKQDGAVVGQVRSSSVWLGEESGAGIVRQIDLVTRPEDSDTA